MNQHATGAVQEADGGRAGAKVPTATGKAEGGGRPGSPASHRLRKAGMLTRKKRTIWAPSTYHSVRFSHF